MQSEIIDELIIWGLIANKICSFSDIEKMDFIELLKLNAVVTYNLKNQEILLEKQQKEMELLRAKNGRA